MRKGQSMKKWIRLILGLLVVPLTVYPLVDLTKIILTANLVFGKLDVLALDIRTMIVEVTLM
ncbi:hypothetical protein LCGC14_2979960, partial [marine sediment metagenome]